MKLTCSKCLLDKPKESFSKKSSSKRGYSYICKSCHNEYVRSNYSKNAEKHRQSVASYKKRNSLKIRAKRYNLSEESLLKLLEEADYKCEICRKDINYKFCVDHCHETSKVRGILCSKCNSAIGLLNDDLELVINAVNYLT